MTMFEDQLYWTDWQTKSVYTTTKFARKFFKRFENVEYEDLLDSNKTEVILIVSEIMLVFMVVYLCFALIYNQCSMCA